MRHEDAGLALWVASDEAGRHATDDCRQLWLAAAERRSIRQRAGQAVIALGERLAGEARPTGQRRPAARRPLVGQTS